MKKSVLIFTLTLGFIHQIFAQSFDKEKLDRYFDTLQAHNKFMGSVAVSQNGKLIYTKTIGFSDFEKKQKANDNTQYRIGSISKTFTSVLILKAVEENKISLDKKLSDFYPSIKNADKISIKNLLNHSSGIHNFTDDKAYLSWNTQKKSEEEMLEIIEKGGSDFEPNSKKAYSNSNYVLLSFILEKVYKKPFSTILEEKISIPFNLKHTALGKEIEPHQAQSYQFLSQWEKQSETDISIPLGAGGIISTATDLTKFSDLLFTGKILNQESLKQMTNIENGFGLGLFPMPYKSLKGFGHTGGIDGFSSLFTHFEENNISFALLSNGNNFSNNTIALTVLNAIDGDSFEIPTFTSIKLSQEELQSFVGNFTSVEIPLAIKTFIDKNTLFAQASGQSAFPLEAISKNKFQFTAAGLTMEFFPESNKMILTQGGRKYQYTKK